MIIYKKLVRLYKMEAMIDTDNASATQATVVIIRLYGTVSISDVINSQIVLHRI